MEIFKGAGKSTTALFAIVARGCDLRIGANILVEWAKRS